MKQMMTQLAATALAVVAFQPAAQAEGLTLGGLRLATDYIAGGVSQNAEKPAISGFIEHMFGNGIYGGLWFSQIDYSDWGMPDSFEIDIYGGIRGEIGRLSYDLGYFRYYYDSYGFDYDEVILETRYAVTDRLGLGAKIKKPFGGRYEDGTLYGPIFGFGLSPTTFLSGQFLANDVDSRELWDIGVSHKLNDQVAVEIRYHDTNDANPLLVASIGWKTRLFSGD